MAAHGKPRWFKVTILRDGEEYTAYDIKASEPGEAENEAWRRYELSYGREHRYDKEFDTRIEEIDAPRP